MYIYNTNKYIKTGGNNTTIHTHTQVNGIIVFIQ